MKLEKSRGVWINYQYGVETAYLAVDRVRDVFGRWIHAGLIGDLVIWADGLSAYMRAPPFSREWALLTLGASIMNRPYVGYEAWRGNKRRTFVYLTQALKAVKI